MTVVVMVEFSPPPPNHLQKNNPSAIRRRMKIKLFDSVWDAIGPSKSEAANMKARAELMIAIHKTVLGWNTTQVAAAKRLGLTQPRLNDLLKGRITKFSLDALINHATLAGLDVKVKVGKAAA
jgi:predicted XRE-type DNA-binding protein